MTRAMVLKRAGKFAAAKRGHDMKFYARGRNTGYFFSECRRCGVHLCVNPKPAPQEIAIGGGAVDTDCPKEKS